MKFKRVTIISILSVFTTSLLVGLNLGEQASVRLKGHLDRDGVIYPFTLISDSCGRIIATISDQNDRREMKIYWDGKNVFKEQMVTQIKSPSSVTTSVSPEGSKFAPSFLEESTIQKTVFPSQEFQVRSIDKIYGEESAVLLFDLIATCLSSSSKEHDFQQKHSIFENYSLELVWNDDLKIKGHRGKAPRLFSLFEKTDSGSRELIREFNYKSFHQLESGAVRPKEMSYSGTNEDGLIYIRSVKQNPGVPDFLFDPLRDLEK